VIARRRLTQATAAERLGVNQANVSALANYKLGGFTVLVGPETHERVAVHGLIHLQAALYSHIPKLPDLIWLCVLPDA
jgi:hypothetical protein